MLETIPSKCPVCEKEKCGTDCALYFDPVTFAVRKENKPQ